MIVGRTEAVWHGSWDRRSSWNHDAVHALHESDAEFRVRMINAGRMVNGWAGARHVNGTTSLARSLPSLSIIGLVHGESAAGQNH